MKTPSLEELASRLQQLEAVEAIRNLKSRYLSACDKKDVATIRDCFIDEEMVIDYGPVNFEHGKTTLWLPWYAELYLQVHGRRYHHRHTLTNYALFSVDTSNQTSAPNQTSTAN